MSLINDALKKAARLRAQEQADLIPPMPGGGHGRVARQREPVRAQTIILIAGAAVALIVVSAVITGILMSGKPVPKAAAAPRPTPEAAPTQAPAKVVVQVPAIALPPARASAPSPTPAPTRVPTEAPKPAEASPVPIVRAEEPPAASSHGAAAAPQSRNELIQGVVDRFHVSGVRSAGTDSKALIDGHVYKVNEVIDRAVGLKLVKVESDHLTFVDADGATYVKSF